MDQNADVPYAMILMMPGIESTVTGDGVDDQGRKFMIQRYVSRTTGKVYDCLFIGAGEPKCAEIKDAGSAPATPQQK